MIRAIVALVLALGCVVVVACGGTQAKSQAQLAAITSGCSAALEIVRDSGEAGAADEITDGCLASLHAWEHSK